MHIMIIKIYNHTNMHVLIFLCLIGQGKIEMSGKSQGILTSCLSGNPEYRWRSSGVPQCNHVTLMPLVTKVLCK